MGARVACVGCDEGGGITYSRSRFNPPALIEQVYRWVVFQSTRPRGARHNAYIDELTAFPFQSTRPRGARPISIAYLEGEERFNPRARAGRDYRQLIPYTVLFVSIHAPARGATWFEFACPLRAKRFNPRARAGRDNIVKVINRYGSVSIHAPARGATF